MRTRLSSKGQLVLPRALPERDGLEAGQAFEVHRVRADEYRLRHARNRNAGLVDRLLARLRTSGQAMPIKDSLIAATALTHCPTRNRRDFETSGVEVIDPFANV
jgi:predicted nucleic acid-binding protein